MDKDSFILDDSNELLNHVYKSSNMKIIEGMANNKKCIVFCSSHGLYFPNKYGEFRTKVICNDFFEGSRLSSLLIEYVERIILIRDIRKCFYVTGISQEHNSIDSVLSILRIYTDGYHIITAGGSGGGGYMASIIGSYLNADYVINTGGQWNLYDHNGVVDSYYFLKANRDNEKCSKWFDLTVQLNDNETPILYFYGAKNELDIKQMKYAEKVNNVYPIAINTQNHAPGVSTEPYLRLLFAGRENIKRLSLMNWDRVVESAQLEEQINTLLELPGGLKPDFVSTKEQKQKAYLDLLYEWLRTVKRDHIVAQCGFHNVAVWGKGRYSNLLISELEEENIKVSCIVESYPLIKVYNGFSVVGIEELPNDVDTIIVVPYYDIDNIKEKVDHYYKNIVVLGIDELVKGG